MRIFAAIALVACGNGSHAASDGAVDVGIDAPVEADGWRSHVRARERARGYGVLGASQTYSPTTESEPDGLGCDYHPNTITQQKMATQLEAPIRTATGW